MDVNKNKVLLNSNSNRYQRKKKEISLISPRNNTNNNTNKIGLVININNQKRLCTSNDNIKSKKFNINNKTLNEIALNNLERENSLLKKEIEIVKSNLIISDKKEQINKKTNKNMFNIINDYKMKEINFIKKIKEIEAQSKKKDEEIENKNKTIEELNNKIEELNERIISLKKIINEKNRILLFLTKKENSQKFRRINSINNIFNLRTMVSSNSCGNIINKIMDFKNITIKKEKHHSKTGLKEILLNEGEENENENKKIKIIRKQSYYKKRIPKNVKNINNNNFEKKILKKYSSNKNIIEHNNNSLNYSLKNMEHFNTNFNINISPKKKRNRLILSNNNTIKEILIDKKNINESNNFSFILNDLEKHQNQIRTSKEIIKNKNDNYCKIIGNKKLKPENMKISYNKKNKLIEINRNYTNNNTVNNSNISSNYSFQSIFPSFQK